MAEAGLGAILAVAMASAFAVAFTANSAIDGRAASTAAMSLDEGNPKYPNLLLTPSTAMSPLSFARPAAFSISRPESIGRRRPDHDRAAG
jgi:hypothetical protein